MAIVPNRMGVLSAATQDREWCGARRQSEWLFTSVFSVGCSRGARGALQRFRARGASRMDCASSSTLRGGVIGGLGSIVAPLCGGAVSE